MTPKYYVKPLLRSVFILFIAIICSALLRAGSVYALDLKDRLFVPSKTFSKLEQSAFLDVELLSGRLVALGERGVIAYSDNGGELWSQSVVPVSTMLTAMHFIDETQGWAVGHSGVVLHTRDAGETWTLQFDGNSANQQLMLHAKDELRAKREQFEQANEEEQDDLSYEVEDAEFALSNAEFDGELGPANPL